MCLPYWDSEIDVEVGAWSPARCVYSQSANRLHSRFLEELSENALAAGSEVLYVSGKKIGAAGSMLWGDPVFARCPISEEWPFTLVLGYCQTVEQVAVDLLERFDAVRAGVTDCTFWNHDVPVVRCKVIAVVSVMPDFDEFDFLAVLSKELKGNKEKNSLIPFYAGRFGFVREPILGDMDKPAHKNIIDKLDSFQLEVTRLVVGPAVSAPMPALYGEHSPSVIEDEDASYIAFLEKSNLRSN